MRSERNALLAAVGMLLAGVIGTVSACGREHRTGASDINRHLSATPSPGSSGAAPYAAGGVAMVTPAAPMPAAAASPNASAPQVSQTIADAVASMNEVKSANVLVAGRSAYVAVVLHYGSSIANAADPQTNNRKIVDVSDVIKTKIAEKVKTTNRQIDNVYVSANPDFVERVNVYAQDIRNGKPVSGFVKEFSSMVERLFPTKAGAATPPGTR